MVTTSGVGLRTVAALACALSLVTACGGSDAGGGGGGNTNGTGTIGANGGSVSLPSGPTLQIPAGALASDTTITIASSTITAPSGAVTSVFEFGPSGTTFTTPVTVSFSVPAGTTAAAAAVYWGKSGSAGQWDVLATTVNGTVATAQVTHFTPGFVGAACAPGTACTPANACHTGATTCNGTPACADSGTSVTDGAACGGGNVCTAGVCGAGACSAGQACTPAGAADPCKTYSTTCPGGVQACGVSGNAPDGTICGSGFVCTAGACGAQNATDYLPVAVSRRYAVTSGATSSTQSNEALTDTSPTWTRMVKTLGSASYAIQAFERSGGATYLTSSVSYNQDGSVNTSSTYSPPELIIPASTAAGTKASSTSTATVTGVAPFTITRSVTVDGLAPVTVSTGTFTALKITTVITQSNIAASTTNVAWYVDGVGQVKSVTSPAGGTTTTFDLTGYSQMACSGGVCACNALVNSAPGVHVVSVPANLPTPTGGTIVDGTYYLTENNIYTGPGGSSGASSGLIRNTYVFQSGLLNAVTWHDGIAGDGDRSTWSVHVSGSQLVSAPTCGASGGGSSAFTSSGNTIRLITPNPQYPATNPFEQGSEGVLTRQ